MKTNFVIILNRSNKHQILKNVLVNVFNTSFFKVSRVQGYLHIFTLLKTFFHFTFYFSIGGLLSILKTLIVYSRMG
jgi:hypothetical protein